ncbi:DNA polymerase III delta subunit [Orenia metallireducens]|uniref:DNA polymerase III subunit delta n=1 Tax=Orenia metallireducens TaxID=1413210 RepID=A0A285G5A6_9FIRM|nr:DNA polymerase III subunit delta [Orenia metallireducens]PRX28359.1 DNA polymerase III delta subunit [Orenia metallireducens]SNY18729.1 DNA polymerase III, delta subunit [Orenia metallireducens]
MQHTEILNKNLDQLDSVYLIYGEDRYLIEEFIEGFTDKFASKELKDFNLNIIEEDEQLVNSLINSVKTLPFMTEKRIVIVYTYDLFKKKVKDAEIIYNLLADFPESTILLFVSYQQPKKSLKIFKEVKKVGKVLKFEALKYKKLDDWIANKIKSYGYQIENSAITLLEEAFNNDLQRLDSEINKIITFMGADKFITTSHIEGIISKDWLIEDNIVFDFVDAIGRKNTSLALKLLSDIMQQGTDAKQILGMIARQIRLMLQSKLLSNERLTVDQIAKRLNQHPYPIKKCLQQSHNFSVDSLELALEKLFETDCRLVTGSDKNLEMELLVIRLKEAI